MQVNSKNLHYNLTDIKRTSFNCVICDALRNLVLFVQFKKREKHHI